MREIKSRGRSEKNSEWLVGSLVCFGNFKCIWAFDADFYDLVQSDRKLSPEYIEVDPATVGQYIGLKDANDVEIYEGDRLRCTDEERDLEWTTVVRYQDTAFVIDIENEEYNVTSIGFVNFDYTKIEVIGNIHNNE